jgi:hypothetical protein
VGKTTKIKTKQMAYNVQSLTNYTNEQNFPILKASILGSKTASILHFKLVSNLVLL